MALKTGGTSSTTVLNAVQYFPSMSASDLAALNALVKSDEGISSTTILPLPAVSIGQIYWPGRGFLPLRAGDWIYVDSVSGQLFLVPNNAVTGGSFVHS